jgi:hypothetical protein
VSRNVAKFQGHLAENSKGTSQNFEGMSQKLNLGTLQYQQDTIILCKIKMPNAIEV